MSVRLVLPALAAILMVCPRAMADPCHEEQKLTSPDPAGLDQFGVSIEISGDTLVVGEYQDDAGGLNAGAAHVYLRSGGAWTHQQKLMASDAIPSTDFGEEVAIDGDTIVVGSHDENAILSGAAYVYVRSGGAWTEQQKLVAPDGGRDDGFGDEVDISGDTLVVGAPRHEHGGVMSGAAYVYVRGAGVWTLQQELRPSDGAFSDWFGSVVICDDTILVGAYLHGHAPGPRAGAAYVFARSGGAWTQEQELLMSDRANQDWAGWQVALSGDTAAVGAFQDDNAGGGNAGAVYLWERSGGAWTEQQKIMASDGRGGDSFSSAVALAGDTLVVGAYLNDHLGGGNAGAAYLFARSGGVWTETEKLVASDATPDDMFGLSACLDDGIVIVGAIADGPAGPTFEGSAYVFTCAPLPGSSRCSAAGAEPACSAGVDVAQACDGVQLAGSVDNPGGAPLAFRWASSCAGTSFAPSDDVLGPIVSFGSACGVSCDLTLTVDAGNGVLCSDVVHVEIDDTTPPSIQADARDNICVWSPRHWWACYEQADFHPVVTDDCGAPTWRFVGCASDQPVDDIGDGHTDPDCLVSPDGDRVCVRAERQGGEPAGRTYTVTIEAIDDCGNSSQDPIATIHVPHDQRNHPECRTTPHVGRRPSRSRLF